MPSNISARILRSDRFGVDTKASVARMWRSISAVFYLTERLVRSMVIGNSLDGPFVAESGYYVANMRMAVAVCMCDWPQLGAEHFPCHVSVISVQRS